MLDMFYDYKQKTRRVVLTCAFVVGILMLIYASFRAGHEYHPIVDHATPVTQTDPTPTVEPKDGWHQIIVTEGGKDYCTIANYYHEGFKKGQKWMITGYRYAMPEDKSDCDELLQRFAQPDAVVKEVLK